MLWIRCLLHMCNQTTRRTYRQYIFNVSTLRMSSVKTSPGATAFERVQIDFDLRKSLNLPVIKTTPVA